MPGADFEVPSPFDVEREDVTAGYVVPAATPVGISIRMTVDGDPDAAFRQCVDLFEEWPGRFL